MEKHGWLPANFSSGLLGINVPRKADRANLTTIPETKWTTTQCEDRTHDSEQLCHRLLSAVTQKLQRTQFFGKNSEKIPKRFSQNTVSG